MKVRIDVVEGRKRKRGTSPSGPDIYRQSRLEEWGDASASIRYPSKRMPQALYVNTFSTSD